MRDADPPEGAARPAFGLGLIALLVPVRGKGVNSSAATGRDVGIPTNSHVTTAEEEHLCVWKAR